MRSAPQWAWPFVLLLAAVVARADDTKPKDSPAKEDPPKSAAEQYQALVKEFQASINEYSKAMREAKTDDERQKVIQEKYPKPQEFAKKFMALAEKYPDDPTAVDSLAWVATNAARTQEGNKATATLLERHVKSDKLGPICASFAYAPDGEKTLRRILAENQHKEVQGLATYSLAQLLKRKGDQGDEVAGKEAEQLLEQITAKFADVKSFGRDLGKVAKGELNEIRFLSVGKVAPDIEAEDIDGVKFKLSDYRGKVVMLDFWGHW